MNFLLISVKNRSEETLVDQVPEPLKIFLRGEFPIYDEQSLWTNATKKTKKQRQKESFRLKRLEKE